jgi:hypothetical protein
MSALGPRLRAYRRLALWAAIVAAVCAATDWPFGNVLGVDWEHHALWAGVLTGGLLLVAGYFGVEAYLRERDEQKWRLVAKVAFKAIGLSAAQLREGMDELLGGDAETRLRGSHFSFELQCALRRCLRPVAGLQGLPAGHHQRRLKLLVDDPRWSNLAVEGLDQLKWRHRETLASWAALMLASDSLADDFSRLARLNEMVSVLQQPLRRRAGTDVRNECPVTDEADVSELILARWDAVVTETVLLHEDFMRAAGEREWTHTVARERLSDAGKRRLEIRDSAANECDRTSGEPVTAAGVS